MARYNWLWLPLYPQESPVQKQDIRFVTSKGSSLTEEEIDEISELFSNHYGTWSQNSSVRPGQKIHLSPSRIGKILESPDTFIATSHYKSRLVGHAIYLRKLYDNIGVVTWVLQLVVHKDFRRIGIATKLLSSIWGFSNDAAWGLATVNPLTIKTLEKATFRKCNPKSIFKGLDIITIAQRDIDFAKDAPVDIGPSHSLIYTDFHIDLREFQSLYNAYGNSWLLGDLKPGWEWLAFTFKHQKMNLDEARFEELVMNSESILKEAYSRMHMQDQSWAKHAEKEVSWIIDTVSLKKDASILDIGCGIGRHAFEFALRGFNCTAIDFSEEHLGFARNEATRKSLTGSINFQLADARTLNLQKKFDLVIMLYDIVGSFANEHDNNSLIKKACEHLNDNGTIILSVMNMELTAHKAKHVAHSFSELSERISNLQPSTIMQRSGDIFNPDYYIIDKVNNLVYRKEQFEDCNQLSVEYIIRDRRYTNKEITNLLESNGLIVLNTKYVQAGRFDINLSAVDDKAKEILIIAKKA